MRCGIHGGRDTFRDYGYVRKCGRYDGLHDGRKSGNAYPIRNRYAYDTHRSVGSGHLHRPRDGRKDGKECEIRPIGRKGHIKSR